MKKECRANRILQLQRKGISEWSHLLLPKHHKKRDNQVFGLFVWFVVFAFYFPDWEVGNHYLIKNYQKSDLRLIKLLLS